MRLSWKGLVTSSLLVGAPVSAANLLNNGSFEGATGAPPVGWNVGGVVVDHALPVAIQYNQQSNYPTGAQGESVPVDNALSLSPDGPGSNGVYFVSDEAQNLSLYQTVYLTPGSYDIGFDSYATFNGSVQPHDATLSATIAGVNLAEFDMANVTPRIWTTHSGTADILTAGTYLVSFTFNTPDTPANPDPTNPHGEYNAKDVVIDQAYVVADPNGGGTPIPSAVPEPASWALMICGFGLIGGSMRRRRLTGSGSQLTQLSQTGSKA